MATNLLRVYNQLLEFIYQSENDNLTSIRRVFNRDFIENAPLIHKGKILLPTPNENGEDTMDILFRHLTTKTIDEKTKKRSLDMPRAIRIHWIRHHLLETIPENLEISFVQDEKRVYILDTVARYVIILEPLRDNISLYLLTAYNLEDSNYRKIKKKIEKRGTAL